MSFFSSHTRRKKTDLQFQMMNIYYTMESPRNKEYDKYPYFKHVIKPQDEIVGYYALKKDYKYVVLRNIFDTDIPIHKRRSIVMKAF